MKFLPKSFSMKRHMHTNMIKNFANKHNIVLTQKQRDILQIIGVTTTVTAFAFQTSVMYKWREEINKEILELKQK